MLSHSDKAKKKNLPPSHEGFTKIIELIFISLCFLVSWCLGGKNGFPEQIHHK